MPHTTAAFSLALGLLVAPATAQWGPIPAQGAPSPRSDALLAFDVINNRTMLFGGNSTNEMWSYDGAAWAQLQPAIVPAARRRSAIAANPFTGEILLYGGQGTGGMMTALDDTWLWNGTTWNQLGPSVSPGGLMWHGMAHDTTRSVVVAFGGRRQIFLQNTYLDETWEYSSPNGTWSQALPLTTPPAVLRPALSYHPMLGVTMMFGGEDAAGQGTDETWIYDGVDWTQINQTGPTPPARAGASLVPILTRNVVVLTGGRNPATFEILNDTWEHDGTQWREISNVYGGIYPARAEAAITHDFVRDRLIAFGGEQQNGGLRNDTWEYGAQWQPFGLSCPGTAGHPTFTPVQLPQIGMTTVAEIGNVPAAIPFAFMAVGLSRTQGPFGSLPTLLTPYGMPNCRLYTSAELLVQIPAVAGVATWSFQIPNVPAFVAEPFYLQGVTFDPGANAFGLAVSKAATMVVGW